MKKRGRCRERIIRVLLNEPEGELTKYKIAKNAECSFSWTHEFLSQLEAMKFIKETKVKDFSGLIEYWRTIKTKHVKKKYMYKDFLELLKKQSMQYALTTYQGENLVQYYLFPSRIDVYIRKEDTNQWHELIVEKGLVGRGNVRLLIADKHVFYGSFERDGLKIVSIPQLIVDLFEEGGICEDAAERLLNAYIRAKNTDQRRKEKGALEIVPEK
jgi:hypothetical protein